MSARESLDLCRWLQTLGLRPTCLLVAHAIGHRVNQDGEAWPSLRVLAADTGLHRATVKRALRDLEDGGVITRTRTWRGHGGHGTTVYGFGGQWDLFRMRAASRRGVGAESAKGRRRKRQAALRPERDHLNGNDSLDSSRSGKDAGDERCGRTFDIEAALDAQEDRARRAARAGFEGPWDDRSVAAFLRENLAVGVG